MNIELFSKILNRIKADPKTWNQGCWSDSYECQTSFCMAGHVVADMGHIVMPNGNVHGRPEGTDADAIGDVSTMAMKALGITEHEADWLFDSERRIEDFDRVLQMGSVEDAIGDLYDEGYDDYPSYDDEDGDE